MQEINEKDWRLFRDRLSKWQEAYMERLIDDYQRILSDTTAASDRFWKLEQRIRHDKRSPGVQLEVRRSTMMQYLAALLQEKVITSEDLDGFSDELRNMLLAYKWDWFLCNPSFSRTYEEQL